MIKYNEIDRYDATTNLDDHAVDNKTVYTDFFDDVAAEEPVETPSSEEMIGEINYSSVNVRSTPMKESGVNNIVKVLKKGNVVSVIDSTDDDKWYKISFDGIDGYCMQEFIDLV